jgi:HPt (histidine-containing phosphotransfer) domain-containing protein/PAS domain-containing protein
MSVRQPSNVFKRLSRRGATLLLAALGAGFLAAVLIPGFELASELAVSTAALREVTEQQRYPDLIRASLEATRDRLSTRAYIQSSLDQLRQSAAKLDAALKAMSDANPAGWLDTSGGTAALAKSAAAEHIAAARDIWVGQNESLQPILAFTGVPYQDNESTGTVLNDSGRILVANVNTALRAGRHALPLLGNELASIGKELQAQNARAATQLRLVMLAGLLFAGLLIVLVTALLAARGKQERSLQQARQQTEDILRTVKEGLFLIDERLIIGSAYSAAMEKLFKRKDIAGLPFADLLQDIVSERTLATAVKFVTVLWAERTNEKLVKSINPLGEVEVHFDNGQGALDTRYLEFDFHRVRVDGKITNVLVSVSDVTARVSLARELTTSQSQAQAQIDTLLGILRVDPAQLASFLNDSNAAMKMINTVLREPAREESAFRKKLDTLFRQAHSVKGEAAALGLSSIEGRAHSFEDDLKGLRDRQGLSGNDFLPLVVKLDDLMTHLQSINDLVSRLSRLQVTPKAQAQADMDANEQTDSLIPVPEFSIVPALQQLVERMAGENHKDVKLECIGLEFVPENYRKIVKDIAIQGVRNAIVHGIETASARPVVGKSSQGTVRLEFQDLGSAGYRFTMEDDGQGLSTEHIKDVAVRKGFISLDQAAALDAKQVFSLLFRPGFSTASGVSKDAGRGVGMNLIAETMRQIGGRVGVATAPGKFTRLTLSLPATPTRSDETEAA